jgi:hypothetical protein
MDTTRTIDVDGLAWLSTIVSVLGVLQRQIDRADRGEPSVGLTYMSQMADYVESKVMDWVLAVVAGKQPQVPEDTSSLLRERYEVERDMLKGCFDDDYHWWLQEWDKKVDQLLARDIRETTIRTEWDNSIQHAPPDEVSQ